MEKREQFSIRKTHLGVGSVLIGIFLITGSVYADETTVLSTTNVVEPPVTVVEKDNSSVVTPYNSENFVNSSVVTFRVPASIATMVVLDIPNCFATNS